MHQTRPANKQTGTPLDRLGYAIATGFGAGHAPIAPGTFGAAEGVVLFLIFVSITAGRLALPLSWALVAFAVVNLLIYAVGVWASDRAIAVTGLKDPRVAVIDEVSGQLIAMTPLILHWSLPGIAVSFLLFRAFDIFKPYPIRKLERLPGGYGVMTDDVLAGVFAALLTWIGLRLSWF